MPRNAVVVIVDRLSASALGPYGNTWLDTPGHNQLARESMLFDFAMSDSPDLQRVYRSYWRGLHSMSTDWGDAPHVIEALTRQGIYTELVTDDSRIGEHELSAAFSERIVLDPGVRKQACREIEQTQLAQLFAAASEALETLSSPFLLWIHARGLDGDWDAPYDLRQQLAEEGDPEPPHLIAPPHMRLEENFDPDQLLGLVQAYAGQVSVLDLCCGALRESIQRLDAPTLQIWTSPRGYPLGEHRDVGDQGGMMFGEHLHVPWLIREPDGRGACYRSQSLVQPPDMMPTLLSWWQLDMPPLRFATNLFELQRSARSDTRPCAVAQRSGHLTVRTAGWLAAVSDQGPLQLFVKPDDRFEANEVASRCPRVEHQFREWLTAFGDAAATGFTSFPLLPEELGARL